MARCKTCGIRTDGDGLCQCPEVLLAAISVRDAEIERLKRKFDTLTNQIGCSDTLIAQVEEIERLKADSDATHESHRIMNDRLQRLIVANKAMLPVLAAAEAFHDQVLPGLSIGEAGTELLHRVYVYRTRRAMPSDEEQE